MTGSTEVAVPEASQVPDLRSRPANDARTLTVEDVKFPRLYIGQSISKHVERDQVKSGDLFVAQDNTDPAPTVLAKRGSDKGVVFYVLDLRKGISRTDPETKRLDTWAWDDPEAPRPSKATGAWVSYTYFAVIPEYDDETVVRILFSRSGRSAAQKINTVLLRLQGEKPSYEAPFKLTTESRSNDAGSWYQPLITPVEPTDEGLEAARALVDLIESAEDQVTAAAKTAEAPADSGSSTDPAI